MGDGGFKIHLFFHVSAQLEYFRVKKFFFRINDQKNSVEGGIEAVERLTKDFQEVPIGT